MPRIGRKPPCRPHGAPRSPLRVAALAALSAGSAYASTCGDGSAIASGGSCALGSFSPTANDNLAGAASVSGGDYRRGVTGQVGYRYSW